MTEVRRGLTCGAVGSAVTPPPALYFVKRGETLLISALYVGPVQMVGGDKGQEVAECL